MKLNHINLGVTDVPATVEIFERYFGLKQADGMPRNDAMTFLRDDDDALISVFKAKDFYFNTPVGFIIEVESFVG
jgi:lactoylglutathione lyase